MAVIIPKQKLIFFHVPKNAGTSIGSWLCKSNGIKYDKSSYVVSKHCSALAFAKRHPDKFSKYFTFGVVRNPWDRVWSMYNFYKSKIGFEKWLYKGIGFSKLRSQYWSLSDGKTIIVNYVVRFETLKEDLDKMAKIVSLPNINKLRHKNATRHKNYKKAYTKTTRELIANRWKDDIEYFGYEF